MRVNVREYEELKTLPSRVSNSLFQDYNKEFRYKSEWRQRRMPWHKIGNYTPWKIVKRVIENNIGKSFDSAFSKFCKMVPVYQQSYFLEEFNLGRQYYRNFDYRIDEEGLIQRDRDRTKYKGPYTFYSDDYRVEEKHIETGQTREKLSWWYKDEKAHLYVDTVVSGFSEIFESRRNRRYKKLNAQKRKEYLRLNKKRRNYSSIDEEVFRRILKEKELKEREENLIKILKHGFDPVTSFRKRKKQV